jgi:hypothetical protein
MKENNTENRVPVLKTRRLARGWRRNCKRTFLICILRLRQITDLVYDMTFGGYEDV